MARKSGYKRVDAPNPFAGIGALLVKNTAPDATNADGLRRALWRLKIRTKQNTEVNFTLNRMQIDAVSKIMMLPKDRKRRVVVLKARQMGSSTLIQGMAYLTTRTTNFARVVTVSHEADATQRLHGMQNFFLRRDPSKPDIKHNRIGAIEYQDTEASHYVGTAGAKSFGRGDTLNFIHGSEAAWWDDGKTLMTGLGEALVDGGWEFKESTANGLGGYFYETYNDASDDFLKSSNNGHHRLFYQWWWDDTYRLPVASLDELLPLTDEEIELVAQHNLDYEQIAWRREKIKVLRDHFLQEYPEDDVTCFLMSGRPYFDTQAVKMIGIRDVREPLQNLTPALTGNGLSVWVEPEPGHMYVAGCDVAEGLEDGDYSVCEIIDVATGEQCAELRGLWPTSVFAEKSCALAETFNHAMVAPERNNHGHAFINHMVNVVKYDHYYMHEEYDARMGEKQRKIGWPTNKVTKPVMLSDLDANIMAGGVKIHSKVLCGELRTMHYNGSGGVEAIAGTHDDAVMSFGIAVQVRKLPQRFQTAVGYFERYQSGTNIVKLPASEPTTDEKWAEIVAQKGKPR